MRASTGTGTGQSTSASAASATEAGIDRLVTEAFFYAFPVHDLARVRWGETAHPLNPSRVRVNQLGHARRLLTAQDRGVTRPNNDTLYSSAWLDLSRGPVSLRLPDMGSRYWSLAFMDPFTDNVACISRRTSGGAARTLWLSSPGTDLPAPAGQIPIRLPAHDIWLLARLLVDGEDDLSAVTALQDSMRLEAPPGERRWSRRPQERDPRAFLTFTNEALGRNPVLTRDDALLRRASKVGLVPGDLGAWDVLSPDIREAWERLLPVLMERLRRPNPAMRTLLGPGWLSERNLFLPPESPQWPAGNGVLVDLDVSQRSRRSRVLRTQCLESLYGGRPHTGSDSGARRLAGDPYSARPARVP